MLPSHGRGRKSANWRRDNNTAIFPETVYASIKSNGRDVSFVALAIISDLLDDTDGPFPVQPEHPAEIFRLPGEAEQIGILAGADGGAHHRRLQAEVFRLNHGVEAPAHDIRPTVVTCTHGGGQRFGGDDLRQDDVRLWIGRERTERRELRSIA